MSNDDKKNAPKQLSGNQNILHVWVSGFAQRESTLKNLLKAIETILRSSSHNQSLSNLKKYSEERLRQIPTAYEGCLWYLRKNLEVFPKMLSSTDDQKNTCLHLAALSNLNAIKMLIAVCKDISSKPENKKLIRELLTQPNEDGWSVLHCVTIHNDWETFKELAELLQGCASEIDTKNRKKPLTDIIFPRSSSSQSTASNPTMFQASSKERVKPNNILHAAATNDTDLIINEIKNQSDRNRGGLIATQITKANPNGFTPIQLAAANGSSKALRALLVINQTSKSINACSKESGKNTALHLTALNGRDDIARDLLNARAIQNLKNDSGFTALDLAITNNQVAWVRTFLEVSEKPPQIHPDITNTIFRQNQTHVFYLLNNKGLIKINQGIETLVKASRFKTVENFITNGQRLEEHYQKQKQINSEVPTPATPTPGLRSSS